MAEVPAHISSEFGLSELSDDEALAVYAEIDKHAEPGAAADGGA
jgi:hypothetical protein